MNDVDTWLATHDDRRARIDALIALVRSAADNIETAVKWRRLTFTVDGNWHHWLCAINVTKADVSLMFHKGALLDDPAGLLSGEGRYLRQIGHDRAVAHPAETAGLVREAIAHQTDMLD